MILTDSYLSAQVADTTDVFNESNPVIEDTLIIINTTETPKLEINKSKSDAFFDSLAAKSKNNNWASQLHRLLIINPYKRTTKSNKEQKSYFDTYKGMYIRDIQIKQLDVFGPSVYDTTRIPSSFSQKLGNSLHISTIKSSIENYLFISENEKVDPYILADNERIIRSLPNIQDARIYVTQVTEDSVDLKIVTKDVWPIGMAFEALDVAYGNVSLWNNNILGLGHQLHFKAHYNLNEDPQYGYLAAYRVPNIRNTLTSFSVSHEEKWDYNADKVYLDRNFLTPALKLGFGCGYKNIYEVRNHTIIDTILPEIIIDYELFDAWGGYSFPLGSRNNFGVRKTIFLTSRGLYYHYFSPEVSEENYLYDFLSKKLILTSAGITWQGYFKTRLVLGFGDTEDIPYGGMLKFTVGKEYNKYTDRLYFGGTFALSKYINRYGFLSNKIEFGSFYNSHLEQGNLNYELLYITPLLGNNSNLFRQFIRINYVQGYNRYTDEYVELSSNEGIRGLYYSNLRGDKRLFTNLEFVYYSPHYVYGFRFVYYTFFDAGLINYKSDALINNPIHSSIGIGLRIRNERLVFNTLQIQFQFFPFNTDIPINNNSFLDVSGTPKLKMNDFANRVPEIIEF